MTNQEVIILLNNEDLIDLLNKEYWIEFYENVINNEEEFLVDIDLKKILELFESKYLHYTKNLNLSELKNYKDLEFRIERNSKLHSDKFSQELISRKMNSLAKALNVNNSLNFAASHQYNPVVQKFINDHKKSDPENFFNLSHPNISIKATSVSTNRSAAKCIFNSPQERTLWEGIRDAYPNHYPLANMALSSVLDPNLVKDKLNFKEMNYFYKSTVDIVVVDNIGEMTPIYYFELDSSFHDNNEVKRKDRMKDKIFEVANVKFLRMRHKNPHLATKEEFTELALEILN